MRRKPQSDTEIGHSTNLGSGQVSAAADADLTALQGLFRLLCVFAAYLLVVEVVTDTLKVASLTAALLRFLPFCGVFFVLIFRARAVVKPNRATVLMGLFLVCVFVYLLFAVIRRIHYFDDVPLIGGKGKHLNDIGSFLMQVAAGCFLTGGYLLLEEIVVGKARLQEQLGKLQKVESVLAESEQRFRTLVEHAPDGIYVQVQGRFAYLNSTAASLFGARSSHQLLNRPVLERCVPEERATVSERFQLLDEERKPIPRAEQKLVRLDGTVFDAAAAAVPFTFNDQNAALVFFRDVTERKRLEEQLRQAQKMEAVGQLAGGVAHDFNNLMTVIEGYCGLLQEQYCGRDRKLDGLDHIAQAARRASNLTQQLLTFSRQQVVQMAPLDLNNALVNLQSMLPRLLGEDITLIFNSGADLPLVEADLGMVEQVLMNLSTNARDAMPKGGTLTFSTDAVELSAEAVQSNPESRTGQFVCLAVADTGSGMDESTRKRAFEPFFTTKEVGKGTGLGLATVYGIVQQHKGWIEVSSTLGVGSTFRIFLPVATSAPAPALPSGPARQSRQGRETILVVEDETNLREMLDLCLRTRGYQVVLASNGVEALALWQKLASEIDLLFTDMLMPGGLNGRELADRLRAEKSTLKVVISSGYSQEVSQHGAPAGHGITFLPKPYQLTTLADAVRKALDDG